MIAIRFVVPLLALVLGTALSPPQAAAQAPAFTPEQSKAIEQIIRDYLIRNPELILEAVQGLEERNQRAKAEAAQRAIGERRDELLNDPAAPIAGNPKGDVAIVEFFDYRCPYCKQVREPMAAMLRDDPKLKIVYKEFPILGPDSVVAARAALAAHAQGKYHAMHDALLRARTLDEPTVMRIAGEVGLEAARLRRDMESKAVATALERNHALARALNITGTPAFVIGDRLVPGAVDVDTLRKLVAEARQR